MKKKKIMVVVLLTTLCFMTSCATIFTGTKQIVQINSIPSGAKIQIDGIDKGKTPTSVKLKKGREGQIITLKIDGYETKAFQPETVFNGVAILNLTDILGWGIDAASGALWKYEPKFYEIELDQKK